ncbi:MAG: ACP S-malonyltransferase, partial [Cryobacterium sp.]|nr:ACP S-malonyltransferase [Oligoflexia bacterium]
TVIAGASDALSEALALVKAGGEFAGKAIPLAVSAPFHCALMAPAKMKMAELFSNAASSEKPSSLRYAYVPNRTANLTAEPSVVFELLVDQVDHPVMWRQSMTTLISKGYSSAVEFGPGKVLQGLAKRIAGGIPGASFTTSGISDSKTLGEWKIASESKAGT